MKNHRGYLSLISGAALLLSAFLFTDDFVRGIESGLSLCGKIIIPSLFPFLIASSLTGSGNMPATLKRILKPFTRLIFGLPAECISALILGQFGGYLSGPKAIQSLRSRGVISDSQAERMLLFSVNAGMGFSVNAIGNGLLGSREAGKVILISLCVSSIVPCFASRLAIKDSADDSPKKPLKSSPFSASVVDSVCSGTKAMLFACGFVIAFSGIGCVAEKLIPSPFLRLVFNCFLEVAKGCSALAGKVPLPVIAAVCAFGGLCVHMQIFALDDDFSVNVPRFIFFRLLHSGAAYAVCSLILTIHPVTLPASVTFYPNAQAFSFSAPAAISLLFLCALLILDLDNNRKIC